MFNQKTLRKVFIIPLYFLGMSASQALTVNAPLSITQTVTIQPIVVSNNDGSNTATFFGNSTQQSSIESLIDQIWAQAGIDVNFLSPTSWNNTFANEGNTDPRPGSDLSTLVSNGTNAGVTSTNANIINLFFVNLPAGFGLFDISPNSAAGLARLGGNGITQFVGSALLTFSDGLDVIAGVVAHEIGHNLGLDHNSFTQNLLSSGGERLNSDQIATALASNLSVGIEAAPVPVPAAFWLFGSALIMLCRKRTI